MTDGSINGCVSGKSQSDMSQAGGSSAEDTPSSAPQSESRAWTPVGTLAQKEGPCAGVSSLMESPKEAAKQQTENMTGFQASRFGEKTRV